MSKRIRMICVCCLLAAVWLSLGTGTAGAKTFDTIWQYEVLADETAIITAYGGGAEDLIIPAAMGDYPVSAIGDGVFQMKRKLRTVVIPEGVKSLGSKVFSSCDGLVSIKLPKSLESIGNRTFSNCKSLKSMELPEKLSSIGANPFALCDNLNEITITGNNEFFEVRESALIEKGTKRLICWLHEANNGRYRVPDDILVIGASAFQECGQLNEVFFPEGLEVIEESAFRGCVDEDNNTGVTNITLPTTLKELQNRAFADCLKLQSIVIPESVTNLTGNPFVGCSNLIGIQLNGSNPVLKLEAGVLIDSEKNTLVCYPCVKQVDEYTVQDGIVRIGDSAFECVPDLVTVTLPDSVTAIGDYAFSNSSRLQTVNMPARMESIGKWAFESCNALLKITVPDGITELGNSTFARTDLLEEVSLPEGLLKIGDGAFTGSKSLRHITIPSTVTEIGVSAFNSCRRFCLPAAGGN